MLALLDWYKVLLENVIWLLIRLQLSNNELIILRARHLICLDISLCFLLQCRPSSYYPIHMLSMKAWHGLQLRSQQRRHCQVPATSPLMY
jgi:hypothetical protein